MNDLLSACEVSIVIPCLNEADTLEACLRVARRALDENGISGEIIVADNGSTDASREIALRNGARLIDVPERGYGSALIHGIAAANGTYVIMGDADESYDFAETPKFVAALRAGNDLVQGCRLPSGGGRVAAGAMPTLHRWWGNPMFSMLARVWFHAPIHDIFCGLRGFSRTFYHSLNLRCTGMEFAVEMIVKASMHNGKISEVPITLHPDKRETHAPHLRTFRDGWRTLRFFLVYSPRWLFLIPGALLMALGAVGYAVALPGLVVGGLAFDLHTLLFASVAMICGYQSLTFSVFTKTFAITEGLLPEDARFNRLFTVINLEKGLVVGGIALLAGLVLLGYAVNAWRLVDFGQLDYIHTMRRAIPGATLTALGFQTVLSSFFLSILGTRRRVN